MSKINMFDHVVELTEEDTTFTIGGKKFRFTPPGVRDLAAMAHSFPIIAKMIVSKGEAARDLSPKETEDFENLMVALSVATPLMKEGKDIDVEGMAAKVAAMNPLERDVAVFKLNEAQNKFAKVESTEGKVSARKAKAAVRPRKTPAKATRKRK